MRLLLLLFALLLSQPSSLYGQSSPCAPDFMFGFIDTERVAFYNTSTNFDQASWDFGQGTVVDSHGYARIVSFAQFPVTVCLQITNDEGCSDQICKEVFSNSPDEMCNWTDCVWPGDTDGDGKANVYDLLPIGLGFNETGPARPWSPSPDPNYWAPTYSDDWSDTINGVNFKHVDADGSGTVDTDDIIAIEDNYNPDFDFQDYATDGDPLVYLEFEDSVIVVEPAPGEPVEVTAKLMLGTFSQPLEDVHGLALSIEYPFELVSPNSAEVDYADNSFFGNINQVITAQKDLYPSNLGRYDLALSRKNSQTANGYGIVAEVSFIIIGDLAEVKGSLDIPFELNIRKLLMVDANGERIPYALADSSAVLVLAVSPVTSTSGPSVETGLLRIAPNPSSGSSTLSWPVAGKVHIRVFDALGRQVWDARTQGHQANIDLREAAPGLYTIQVEAEDQIWVDKWVVR